MRHHPNRGDRVALVAQALTAAVLPTVKRKRLQQRDPRLRQVEKDLQRGRAKAAQHIALVLVGRVERGAESLEAICAGLEQFPARFRAILGAVPATCETTARRTAQKEIGEALSAIAEYEQQQSGPARAKAAKEVSEAERALRPLREQLVLQDVAASMPPAA